MLSAIVSLVDDGRCSPDTSIIATVTLSCAHGLRATSGCSPRDVSSITAYDHEMSSRTDVMRRPGISKQTRRWLVHVALIATAAVSLTLEFVLMVHIIVGLIFVALVIVHLVQRRRTSSRLLRRLARVRLMVQPQGRLAVADLLLALLTLGMLGSGLLDWSLGHPTQIRYHALLGVGLAILLVTHSVNRWKRLRTSRVR